jgi:hypothetical protein
MRHGRANENGDAGICRPGLQLQPTVQQRHIDARTWAAQVNPCLGRKRNDSGTRYFDLGVGRIRFDNVAFLQHDAGWRLIENSASNKPKRLVGKGNDRAIIGSGGQRLQKYCGRYRGKKTVHDFCHCQYPRLVNVYIQLVTARPHYIEFEPGCVFRIPTTSSCRRFGSVAFAGINKALGRKSTARPPNAK